MGSCIRGWIVNARRGREGERAEFEDEDVNESEDEGEEE
jgi:hypothetical protein